jgi:phage FluMu protein Com
MKIIKSQSYVALLKTAEPHAESKCPLCKTEVVVDLLWERPDEATTYRAIDDTGREIGAAEAAQLTRQGRLFQREWSEEELECPQCGNTWYSKFERDPLSKGNVVREEFESVGFQPHDPHHHATLFA